MPKRNIITSSQLHVIEIVDALVRAGLKKQAIADASGVSYSDMSEILKRNTSRINDAAIEKIDAGTKKIFAKIAEIERKTKV